MPEREISREQRTKIYDWIRAKSEDGLLVPLFPTSRGVDIYRVNNEPLVVYEGKLLCSDRHAKELEEAGIVDFSETPQSTS